MQMSDPATKLNTLRKKLLEKKKMSERQIANFKWHNIAGPILMIEVKQLELINEMLKLCMS